MRSRVQGIALLSAVSCYFLFAEWWTTRADYVVQPLSAGTALLVAVVLNILVYAVPFAFGALARRQGLPFGLVLLSLAAGLLVAGFLGLALGWEKEIVRIIARSASFGLLYGDPVTMNHFRAVWLPGIELSLPTQSALMILGFLAATRKYGRLPRGET